MKSEVMKMKMLEVTNAGLRIQDKSFNVQAVKHGQPVIEDGKPKMTGEIRSFPYSEIESFKVWRIGDMKAPKVKIKWKEGMRSNKSDALYHGDYEIYELTENTDMEKGKEFAIAWTYKMNDPVKTYYQPEKKEEAPAPMQSSMSPDDEKE